jgi:cyclopropane fatty-acyl-phospholipid synthase-like methyltransferase
MDLLHLVDLLELADMDQKTSYATPLKLVALGKILGLGTGSRVIDFGCAKAKALILWAKHFGITGVGIELGERFCREATEHIGKEGLTERLQIVCHDGATYPFEPGSYDVACCIGASEIWGGFRPTLQALKQAITPAGRDLPGGQIVIGEPYYAQKELPQELIDFEGEWHTEVELLDIIHEEGCELGHILRASSDDRDGYTALWPYEWKRIYVQHMRALHGWAMYLIRPRS